MTSFNKTEWKLGVPITIDKPGTTMCSDQVLHCYNHPLLASFLNPVHANISNPRLFEIEVDKIVNTDGLKFASKSQTLLQEIGFTQILAEKRVKIAILIAKTVNTEQKWNEWADRWLSGEDRSRESTNKFTEYYYKSLKLDDCSSISSYHATIAALGQPYYYDRYAASTANYASVSYGEGFNEKLIQIVESVCSE